MGGICGSSRADLGQFRVLLLAEHLAVRRDDGESAVPLQAGPAHLWPTTSQSFLQPAHYSARACNIITH